MPSRASFFALVLFAGCPSKKPPDPTPIDGEAAPRDAQAPARAVDPAKTGAISGWVKFKGTPPDPVAIDMRSNAACAAMNPRGVMEPPAVSAGGEVRGAFVWVKSKFTDVAFAASTTPVVLDQKGCRYHPRVVGVMVGQPLEIRNSDSTSHNVNATAKVNEPFNVGMSMRGVKETKRFKREEVMMKVGCDIHPWMAAYVGVVAHPFFAVTGVDGAFSLPGVPAGEHVVGVWHEKFGTREAKVTVTAKGEHKLPFEFGN